MTRWLNRWPMVTAMVPVIVLWELFGRLKVTPMVPPLSEVLTGWWTLVTRAQLLEQIATSMVSLLGGYALALVVGVAIGTLVGHYGVADAMLSPYLDTMMSAPMAAFVPVLVLIFGLGKGTIAATVFLYAVFVIAVNVRAGVRSIESNLLEMAHSVGASESLVFRRILLPGALPLAMTGIRLGFSRAVKGLVIGEALISLVGLGGMLQTYGGAFDTKIVYALIITLVTIALIGVGIIRVIERRVITWRR